MGPLGVGDQALLPGERRRPHLPERAAGWHSPKVKLRAQQSRVLANDAGPQASLRSGHSPTRGDGAHEDQGHPPRVHL